MATFRYFAYGSNMLEERLRRRCASARAIGTAQLRGWSLSVHKRSFNDGSGKATVESDADPATTVHGVLYEIDEQELAALDRFEGYQKGYDRREVEVELAPSGIKALAITYIADAGYIDRSLQPYDWYLALMVAGAREHRLPNEYIDGLHATPSIADPVPDRSSRLEALALLEEVSKT